MTIRIDQFGNRDIRLYEGSEAPDDANEWIRIGREVAYEGPAEYHPDSFVLMVFGGEEDYSAIIDGETLREIRDEINRVLGVAPKRGGLLR